MVTPSPAEPGQGTPGERPGRGARPGPHGAGRRSAQPRSAQPRSDRPQPARQQRASRQRRPRAGYRTRGELGPPALLDLLAERLIDYRSQVRRTAPEQVLDTVRAALAGCGARRVVLPPGLDLPGLDQPQPGQPGSLDGVELITDGGLSAQELDQMDGVITRAAVAVAETGTIVLDAGPGPGPPRTQPDPRLSPVPDRRGPGGRAGP